jgi:hypothetical protein
MEREGMERERMEREGMEREGMEREVMMRSDLVEGAGGATGRGPGWSRQDSNQLPSSICYCYY